MSKKFLNKVTAERAVLSALNGQYPELNQLEGLTSIAIRSWYVKNNIFDTDKRVITLLALSDLCHKMSDRSQESFESIDESVMDEILVGIPYLLKIE